MFNWENHLFWFQLGKSVVARYPVRKGTELTLDMLGVKVAEPQGIPPENIFKLVGKKITVDLQEDDTVTKGMVKAWLSLGFIHHYFV